MMIAAPKILMYAPIDASLHNACTLHVFGIAKGFAENGFEVDLVLPKSGNKSHSLEFSHPDVHIHYHSAPGILNTFKPLWAMATLMKRLIKKPSFFYVRMHHLTWLLVIMAKVLGVRVCSEHTEWQKDRLIQQNRGPFVTFLGGLFQKIDAKLATKVRLITPGIGTFLKSFVRPESFFVAGNGADTTYFYPKDRDECIKAVQLHPDFFYLGFVGTLAAWQGLHFAIAALAPLLKSHKNIRLIIAGSGTESRALKAQVFDLGLDDQVIFTGHIYFKDIVNMINAFDIALAPFTRFRNEDIGLSALKIRDYAACGRTIVTSNIRGNENVNDFGVLFAPDDAKDLLAKVNFLIENPAICTALSKKARLYAETHFSWKHVATTIIREMGA